MRRTSAGMLMWSATKTTIASGFGFLQYSSIAASFSSFEPRPKRDFTPRTKKTWNGAMSEGVRARSRTSARSFSARSNSKMLKSRSSAGTRCCRIALRKRLRKNASSPANTYAARSLRDSSSLTKRSALAKARIRKGRRGLLVVFRWPTTKDQRPTTVYQTLALVVLQDVGNQGAGKILRESPERRRVLFEETGKILRDFVLLAKQIRRILVDYFPLPVRQRNFHAYHNQDARRLSRRRVVGEWRGRSGEHGSAQRGIGRFARIVLIRTIEDVVMRPRGELAHHRSGQHLLDAISIGLVLEGRNSDGLYVCGKLHRVADRVVAAARAKQQERQKRKQNPHGLLPPRNDKNRRRDRTSKDVAAKLVAVKNTPQLH